MAAEVPEVPQANQSVQTAHCASAFVDLCAELVIQSVCHSQMLTTFPQQSEGFVSFMTRAPLTQATGLWGI